MRDGPTNEHGSGNFSADPISNRATSDSLLPLTLDHHHDRQCGATDYWAIGRTKETRLEYPCLSLPHKLKELDGGFSISTCAPTTLSLALRSPGKNIKFIAAGSAACHSVAVDDEGTCYVWGRNEKGQLGLGDQLTRNVPTELTALKGVAKVVSAACGRYHTVFVTDTGDAYASGCNSSGQCGQGFVKKLKKGGRGPAAGAGQVSSLWLQ